MFRCGHAALRFLPSYQFLCNSSNAAIYFSIRRDFIYLNPGVVFLFLFAR